MKIDHMAMYVNDLNAARDFFVKYLDARPGPLYHNENTGFCSYFLSFEGGARLEIMTRPNMDNGARSKYRTGYAHLAFSLGSREQVDALTARLTADGFSLVSGPRTTGDGYYESCLAALEGNLLELTE